jgi:hypothetical protein
MQLIWRAEKGRWISHMSDSTRVELWQTDGRWVQTHDGYRSRYVGRTLRDARAYAQAAEDLTVEKMNELDD